MARRMSRAKRLGVFLDGAREGQSILETILGEISGTEGVITREEIDHAQEEINKAENHVEVAKDGVDELKEEIGSWKENMEGANMEHLPKYDEVSECYDALETAYDSLDNIDWPDVSHATITEDAREEIEAAIQDALDALESAIEEAEQASFPSMF